MNDSVDKVTSRIRNVEIRQKFSLGQDRSNLVNIGPIHQNFVPGNNPLSLKDPGEEEEYKEISKKLFPFDIETTKKMIFLAKQMAYLWTGYKTVKCNIRNHHRKAKNGSILKSCSHWHDSNDRIIKTPIFNKVVAASSTTILSNLWVPDTLSEYQQTNIFSVCCPDNDCKQKYCPNLHVNGLPSTAAKRLLFFVKAYAFSLHQTSISSKIGLFEQRLLEKVTKIVDKNFTKAEQTEEDWKELTEKYHRKLCGKSEALAKRCSKTNCIDAHSVDEMIDTIYCYNSQCILEFFSTDSVDDVISKRCYQVYLEPCNIENCQDTNCIGFHSQKSRDIRTRQILLIKDLSHQTSKRQM